MNGIIKIRYDISQRAAFMTKGNTTIHAPTGLFLSEFFAVWNIKLLVVFDPFLWISGFR
jgi:hypothetical protein